MKHKGKTRERRGRKEKFWFERDIRTLLKRIVDECLFPMGYIKVGRPPFTQKPAGKPIFYKLTNK